MNRPEIIIIVAVAHNGAIGRNGDLLFHISEDLRRFKALTMGYPVIMGRKTFESFPKGPLPGRRNIVITRNQNYDREGIETADSLEGAINLCRDAEKIFIIGGGEIYRQAIGIADVIELTAIETDVNDADTFFPDIDKGQWHLSYESEIKTDPRNNVNYRFISLKK